MEEPSNSDMIVSVISYLAKKLKDNKSVNDFFNDFTDATVKWLRPLFLKEDNNYEKIIEDLMKKPDSAVKKQQVEIAIASHLDDHPEDEQNLKEMYEKTKNTGSELAVKKVKGKKGVEFKAKMKNSRGNIEEIESEEGKTKIDIDLS